MSSPPPPGSSLTAQALSRKRPSMSGVGPSAKRRKPSISSATSSQHPLRQTSFPPENFANSPRDASYSPAVEDSVSSVGRSTRGGRKSRSDARSMTGGSTTGGRGRRRGSKGTTDAKSGAGNAAREEEEPDDDEGDGAVDTVLEGGGKMDEAALKQEREHLA